VMQPKNGKVYQCRPFPYSGYCVQWSQYATQFEPGIGSDWAKAWTEVTH
ncbi:TPA: N-acetylglucosamine-binding protein GbpA, partial [Klebsiella michiganensis]|nr:N-acetylglucosamine-binding protein GbpA [Klebsiella michiganensis]